MDTSYYFMYLLLSVVGETVTTRYYGRRSSKWADLGPIFAYYSGASFALPAETSCPSTRQFTDDYHENNSNHGNNDRCRRSDIAFDGQEGCQVFDGVDGHCICSVLRLAGLTPV
jgi:hypothetical protein